MPTVLVASLVQWEIQVDWMKLQEVLDRHPKERLVETILDEAWFVAKHEADEPARTYQMIIHLNENPINDWVGCRIERDGRLVQGYQIWCASKE
jgi:hypothetical protein